MIRQVANDNLRQHLERVCQLPTVSCITWFISSGIPEGAATWLHGTVANVPLLSTQSVLAFHQVQESSVVRFRTADLQLARPDRPRRDNERHLLEDSRAYLGRMSQGVEPTTRQREAWGRFFEVYTRQIRSVARACGLSAADAEDCVQDVWMVILGVLKQSERELQWDRFCCWIRGLIHNQVVEFVRRLARRPDRWALSLDDAVSTRDLDPVANCEQSERRRLVRHVLGDLQQQVSATNYRVVQLRWMEGRGVSEVAARLDLTSEQVWYRHHRVKKHLRRLFECHGERFG